VGRTELERGASAGPLLGRLAGVLHRQLVATVGRVEVAHLRSAAPVVDAAGDVERHRQLRLCAHAAQCASPAFVTDRDLPLPEVEADDRRHAIVEQSIAELRSAGLKHAWRRSRGTA
jgi:hypothetical protein